MFRDPDNYPEPMPALRSENPFAYLFVIPNGDSFRAACYRWNAEWNRRRK